MCRLRRLYKYLSDMLLLNSKWWINKWTVCKSARIWFVPMYGYARVAGGGSPRHKMTERFRNRYLCKFDYMNHNFGEIGCTGCGRCTEACTAQIDFRKAVKNISKVIIKNLKILIGTLRCKILMKLFQLKFTKLFKSHLLFEHLERNRKSQYSLRQDSFSR